MSSRVRWDWIAGPMSLLSMLVQGWGWHFEAWAIGAVCQLPWWMIILEKRTWGLAPTQVAFTAVCFWNVYAWWPAGLWPR